MYMSRVSADRKPSIENIEMSSENPINSSGQSTSDGNHSLYLTLASCCTKTKDRHNVDASVVKSWDPKKTLRWVTCRMDDEANQEMLQSYVQTMELLSARFPEWSVHEKVDWAVAKYVGCTVLHVLHIILTLLVIYCNIGP